MKIECRKTQFINWNDAESIETKGKTGFNTARVLNAGNARIQLVEYSAHYKSAGLCEKGHIVHCIEGEITLHFSGVREIKLIAGNSIVISEGDSHTASTENISAKLFVID